MPDASRTHAVRVRCHGVKRRQAPLSPWAGATRSSSCSRSATRTQADAQSILRTRFGAKHVRGGAGLLALRGGGITVRPDSRVSLDARLSLLLPDASSEDLAKLKTTSSETDADALALALHLVPWTAAKSLGSLRGGNAAPDGYSTREESENNAAAKRRSASLPTKLLLLASASCGLVVDVLIVQQLFSLAFWSRRTWQVVCVSNASSSVRVYTRQLAILAAQRAKEALLPREFRLISAGREIPKGWRLATNYDLLEHRKEAMRVLCRQTAVKIANGDCVYVFDCRIFLGSIAMKRFQGDLLPHVRKQLEGDEIAWACAQKHYLLTGDKIGKQLIVANAVGQPWNRGLTGRANALCDGILVWMWDHGAWRACVGW